ncbi:hypothetical protein Mapa_015886 [Marchantia paleacea]|nr:hypothetical protein Mapa_015886 [Marchantia paleacea]
MCKIRYQRDRKTNRDGQRDVKYLSNTVSRVVSCAPYNMLTQRGTSCAKLSPNGHSINL